MIESELQIASQTKKLKSFLTELLKKFSEIQKKEVEFQLPDLFPLRGVIHIHTTNDEDKKRFLAENALDGEKIVSELQTILSDNEHLHQCCVTPDRLAMVLDKFISEVFRLTAGEFPDDEKLEEYFDEFFKILYKEPFRAVVYSHIFNFTSDMVNLEFGEFYIQQLDLSDRFTLLRDHTSLSFLHPHENIGTHFIVSTGSGLIEDDWSWLIQERTKAEDIARLFQYFKDGVVHINYSAVHFYPEWVNPIRNGGVFFYGEERKFPYEMGEKMYSINEDEYVGVAEWLSLYQLPEIVDKFNTDTVNKNDLGKKIELAGIYFEASHTHYGFDLQLGLDRRLIDLAIALELILHPHNKDEISFQLSQLAAQLLGKTSDQKKELFKDVKLMYSKRSNIFHGNLELQEKKPVTLEEIERWSSLIRKSLLKLITLYIRGEKTHKNIIQRLRDSLFDADEATKLMQESDINLLIKELKKE